MNQPPKNHQQATPSSRRTRKPPVAEHKRLFRSRPLDPDVRHRERFYRHFLNCNACQLRSWQDGRLCSVGNELIRRRSPSSRADAYE